MAVSKTLLTQLSAPLGIFDLPVATQAGQPVIKSTYDGLAATVSGLSGDVSTLNTDLSTLQGVVATNTSDISTIGGDVSNLNTSVGSLETTVTGLSSDVATLQTNVSTLQSEVAAIKAPYLASYAFDAAVWSVDAGVATMTLTNAQHSLGTSRMSNFSIVVTEASGSLEADEDITSLGKVKRAANGTVTFSIDASYLVSTFNTAVAVFA